MTAGDLQPGMSFRRHPGQRFRKVKEVKDFDLIPNASKVMRGKVQVTCADGETCWLYKTEVMEFEIPHADPNNIEVNYEPVN